MRLLDARTLQLVDVTDDGVPPYAILSHTWGDEEITIQQLRRLGGSSQLTSSSPKPRDKKRKAIVSKKGYMKIAGAAQLALSRGLNYIWADTCCIDKTSSAELSEAINSMYLWYEQSAECYAFLSDVEPVITTDASAFHQSLRHSRWFTRGWTLQELIAPKLVLFYANDWSLLGQKHTPAEFTKMISEITSIDGEILDGRIDPLQLSVSARMAWASHRNTTRLEDTAYCLMGLFQVNMPLLYGEGRRAFTRLQEEIIQRTDDQSIFAWNSFDNEDEDPDALFGLLAQSPAQFKDAGALQVLPPLPVYASAPSGMTNQGLRVQLYLLPRDFEDETVMEEDYFAILDCVKRDRDVYLCPTLHLRRLSEDQYGRLQPKSQHFKRPIASSYLQGAGYQSVYIRQQPVYYHLPQFRLSPLNVESGLGSSDGVQYRLLDKFPTHNWNAATMTLKVQYSRKLQAMGVFRFQSIEKSDEQVDVVVGLRRLKTMEWEGWCFQLSYRDVSLEHTFHEVNKQIEKITSKSINGEITSRTLRDSLGDDSSLASSATVEGIQLQGRLYISILVTLTAEISAARELFQISAKPITLSRCNQILSSTSANSGARAMTEICCWSSSSPFGLDAISPLAWIVQPVRVASSSGEGAFMKPIHDFLAALWRKPSGKVYKELSVAEKLAEALFLGEVDQVQALIAIAMPNIDLPTTDAYGFAPLHWAVAGGSAGCIQLLRRNGANLRSLTGRGLSAAHIAALCNSKVWDALADSDDQTELARLANERTKHFSETPIHLAAASSPDTEFGTAFFIQLMEWSWEHTGLTPRNAFDETPLHRAAAGNNVGAIRALATRSYHCYVDDGDQYGRTPLWHAAAAGAHNAIVALIRLGATVNLTDDLGRSPLHAACRGGRHEAVNALLEQGARTDTETNLLSLLPMDLAAMFGFTECLNFLLDPRWRAVTQTNLDRALQIAASFGQYECVDRLCRHGANPYVAFEYYLQAHDGYAIAAEEEADAHTAASLELHTDIVSFFNTSETCRHLRERMYPSTENNIPPSMENPMPSFSAPVDAPLPTPESAPVYLPDYGRQHTPSYSNPAYGNTPSSGDAPPSINTPYGGTPSYGGRLGSASPYTPQQGPPRYQYINRHQSANVPARASPSAYIPTRPTQSERLQELVNPYESSQGPPRQQRPVIVYSSTPAAEAPSQDSGVAVRNASVPAPRSLPYRIVEPPITPLDVGAFTMEIDEIEQLSKDVDEEMLSEYENSGLLYKVLYDYPDVIYNQIAERADFNDGNLGGRTRLHEVFSHEVPNLTSAESIRRNGGNINTQDFNGDTPLWYAVCNGESVPAVEWLLGNGADPNLMGQCSPLQRASSRGQTTIVRMLLEAGADPNSPSYSPPLFQAMGLSHHLDETVHLLLTYGANPAAEVNGALTPLGSAIRQNRRLSHRLGVMREVYDQARRRGTPYTAEQLNRALSEYCGQRYPRDLMEQFLEWNPDANQKLVRDSKGDFTRPLIVACSDEDVDMDAILHLLRMGADATLADHNGNTPLHTAIQTGAPDTVILLLDAMTDPKSVDQVNQLGQTALHIACEKAYPVTYRVYRNIRYFLGSQGKRFNDGDVIRRLNTLTEDEYTAVKHARCINIVRNLLDKGASPYAQDNMGATPLHYACKMGLADVVRALRAACLGKYVLKDKQGQTPLHWAAKYGKASAVEAMARSPPLLWPGREEDVHHPTALAHGGVSRRVLPNVADQKGRLAIHFAAMRGDVDTMDAFLLYWTTTANYQAKDAHGHTALWYAQNGWNDDCATRLRGGAIRREKRYVVPTFCHVLVLAVSLLALVVTYPSAVVSQGRKLLEITYSSAVVAKACRYVVVGWRCVVVSWRCVVAGWQYTRNRYCESHVSIQ
ncbi:hypothetical protein ACHAQJ_005767 [Trichoderma viride]